MNAINRSEVQSFSYQDPAGLEPAQVLDIIFSRRFGVEYQPIVQVQSGEIVGYQASARFWTHDQQLVNAGRMFDCLHRNPLLLFHTEFELKKLQILRNPAAGWLILDLDIDSFLEGGDSPQNPFLQLFREFAWSEQEVIINVVENANKADAIQSQRMIELLQESGIAVALEDVGVRWGMFSLSAFMDARVIKFNGLALKALNEDAANATLEWLVSAAKKIGVQTILDGVSNPVQLEWARDMGVDCVQGRLFAGQSIQVRS